MTEPTSWRAALERLVAAPLLTSAQGRFLVETLGAPREQVLEFLLEALGSGHELRAEGAAFLLSNALTAADRPFLQRFMESPAPVTVRAHARLLFQTGLLSHRLKEEEAELTVPPGEAVAFLAEDVAREGVQIPSLWQRSRVAAESLVSDTPLPDDAAPSAVSALAKRLDVEAARIFAELLIHPLTRPAYREAARQALQTPSAAAATQLELAIPALLPGVLRETAVTEAARHRAGAGAPSWRARMGGCNAQGRFGCVLWTDAPEPMALAGLFGLFPQPKPVEVRAASGEAAEQALVLAGKLTSMVGPLVEVPVPWALSVLEPQWNALRATSSGASKGKKDKGKPAPNPAQQGLLEWLQKAPLTSAETGAAIPSSEGVVDVALMDHPLVRHLKLTGEDFSSSTRQWLGRELKGRTQPRADTVESCVQEVAGKRSVVQRLGQAMEHGARVAMASGDAAAPGLSQLARVLTAEPTGRGQPLLTWVVRQTLLAAMEAPTSEPSSRDQLRDEVLMPSQTPSGLDVLALDLSAASLDALLALPKGLEGLSDEGVTLLCVEAGRRAAAVVARGMTAAEETAALGEAVRETIKVHGGALPSRQRRDMADAWLAAWQELLTNACRSSCPQQCPKHVAAPRPMGGYSLDHPRDRKPWP